MLPIKWQFFDDFADLASRNRGGRSLPALRRDDWLVFLAGKLTFFSLAFLLPLQFDPFCRCSSIPSAWCSAATY
jgi:linoleoyl-CoA desaturase